ncbi:MAG: hypothetical protein K2L19_01870 [Eubacterium sp.]|nr:hypothetical protein [Eubacterium sp.]
MKKNRNIICTAAAVLFYLVLITLYLLGGIFSRFTVASSSGDLSRTAKYGVVITTQGSVMNPETELFPGLAESEGLIFSLSGKPEVAVSIGCELESNDVCLPQGYYHVDYGENTIQFITENNHGAIEIDNPDHYRFCFHAEKDYHPIRFNIYHRDDENSEWIIVESAENITKEEIVQWFENEFNSTIEANTDLSELGEWKITSAWPQKSYDDYSGDQSYMDTLLCASQRITWIDSDNNEVDAPEGFANQESLEFSFEIIQLD